MIPTTNTVLTEEIELEQMPSLQHKMILEGDRIKGTCDGLDAIVQTVHNILNTERYEYPIHSWDYGIELMDLYGEDPMLVCAELQSRIEDALLQDDRIQAVDNYEFDTSQKGKVHAKFTVETVFGDVEEEMVVDI